MLSGLREPVFALRADYCEFGPSASKTSTPAIRTNIHGDANPAHRLSLHLRRGLPKAGKGAALILPACNTETMNLRLVESAKTVSLVPTPSYWSIKPAETWSTRLVVPPNITLIPLPPKCPKLNLVALHSGFDSLSVT